MKKIKIALLFLLLFSSATALQAKEDLAPDFTLSDLNGRQVSLHNYKGKSAVLLSFWATWCSYCKKEIPHLVELQNQYKGHGLTVLAVNVDPNDTVSTFAKKYGINYPVLLDKPDANGSYVVSALYSIRAIPTVVLVDKQGKVRYWGNRLPDNKLIESVSTS